MESDPLHFQEISQMYMLDAIDIAAGGPFVEADHVFGVVVGYS